MNPLRTAILAAILMVGTSTAAVLLKPAPRDPSLPPALVLEKSIPKEFGAWRELTQQQSTVVNPQTQELLDKLYSQILSRSYADDSGYVVMLSMAYGDDQRGGLQAHMPEVCYPAQGFTLLASEPYTISTGFGTIAGRRLNTRLGQRVEPITYWFSYGGASLASGWQRRMIDLRMGLTGQVPDGLLLRVSSIDTDTGRAYGKQEQFVQSLLKAVSPDDRLKLGGGN